MRPVSSGLMGPTCSMVLCGPPSSVTVCDCRDWFEIRMVSGPAPSRLGSTETDLSVITPESSRGTAGRGLSLKSLPLPQPTSAGAASPPTRSTATRVRPTLVITSSPTSRGGTLPEPYGRSRRNQVVDRRLDPLPDLILERLDELEVVRVGGTVTVERDRLEEADLELCRQVHQPGREPEVRE